MTNKMSIDKKIIKEIERYRSINKYLTEQDAPPAPPPPPTEAGAPPPPAGGTPPPPTGVATDEPEVIDVEKDQDVEKIDEKGKSQEKGEEETEELEITDLVKSQENIEKKQEDYFKCCRRHFVC